MIYGLVAPGYEMAEVVAAEPRRAGRGSFTGFDMSTKLKLMGVDVASFGDPFAEPSRRAQAIITKTRPAASTRSSCSTADGKHLLGGVLVGDASDYGNLLAAVQGRQTAAGPPRRLLLGGGDRPGVGVGACPRRAGLLAATTSAKAAICDAIRGRGAHRRSPRSRPAPRPAPAAAAACPRSKTCSRPSWQAVGSRSQPASASTSTHSRARSSSRSSRSAGSGRSTP